MCRYLQADTSSWLFEQKALRYALLIALFIVTLPHIITHIYMRGILALATIIVATLCLSTRASDITAIDNDTIYTPQEVIEQIGDTPTVFVLSKGEEFYRNKYVQMTYVGVPLVIAGIASQQYIAQSFYDLRNAYTPDYHCEVDDYLQFAPGVAAVIMKACGVQSRSSWGRMVVSDAFSVAIMAALVNGIKYSVGTLRPDGSTYNSFPSGHTATAFTAAHILHKEYGELSPWISVGGYTVATFVGVSRILNNRHWISDVLAGAGIGILSTELGYFLADLIFKDKGLHNFGQPDFTIPHAPSQIGITMGMQFPLSAIELGNGQRLTSAIGSRMGVDGAWYINSNWGIGGSATVASLPTILESRPEEPLSIDAATVAAGVYGSLPLGENSRFRISMKALAGCNFMAHTDIIPNAMTSDDAGFYYELGLSLSFLAQRHFAANIFCDYGGYTFGATHTALPDYGLYRTGHHNYMMHNLTTGITTSILF